MCGRTASHRGRFTAALIAAIFAAIATGLLTPPTEAQPRRGMGRGGPPPGTMMRSSSSSSDSEEKKSEDDEKTDDSKKDEDEKKKGDEDKEKKDEKKDEGPVFVVVPEQPDGDQLISLSFDQADIDHVLKFIAQASGKTIIKEPSVKCKVTIISMAKITVREALSVLSAFLSVKGYSMIEDDGVIRVIPREAALREKQEVRVGKEPEDIADTDEIITQIMVIENVDANALAEVLKPLTEDKKATLLAHPDTNTLVMIDRSSNVRRMAEIIARLDQDTSEAQQVEVIKLEVAEASEVAQELNELFKPDEPISGLPRDVQQRLMQSLQKDASAAGALLGPQGLARLKGRVKIVADERTNALIVMASEENLKAVKEIVDKIDEIVPLEISAKTIKLEYAEAVTIAEQIQQLFGDEATSGRSRGFMSRMFSRYSRRGREEEQTGTFAANRIVPDQRTNSIIVTADEDNMQAITGLVAQLDVVSDVDTVTEIFDLENASADDVAETLYDLLSGGQRRFGGFFFFLFGSQRNEPGKTSLDLLQEVNVVAHQPTNTLLVSGPPQTFETVRELVQTLDQRVPQVFIEVVIADVTLGDDERFGIEWASIGRHAFGSDSAVGEARTAWDLAADTVGFRYSLVSNSLKVLLDTLETERDVKVISTPHIMVLDNEDARISIGERIPYVASQDEAASGTIQRSTEFQEVNISLEVTPHVNWREYIKLELTQTVNSLIEIDPVLLAPRTSDREAQTVVEVRDGQTMVIGGIISERESLVRNGVPVLRRIPWLGPALFESTRTETQRSELIVFLTPHIIVNEDQVDQITEGEGLRSQTYSTGKQGLKFLEIESADIPAMRKAVREGRGLKALEEQSSDVQAAPEAPQAPAEGAEQPAEQTPAEGQQQGKKPPVPTIVPAA